MHRVLLAGLFHETHTFVEEITPLEQFRFLHGQELMACEGDGSPLGGVLQAARRFDWQVIPTVDCRAQPSGTASDEVFETFWSHLRPQVQSAIEQGLDAIYLVLHGAMVTVSHRDVEGELLERLRAIPGVEYLPIFGVFDLHAGFSERMARYSNCLVAYRENPHADACVMAIRAAELLEHQLQHGQVDLPHTLYRPAGIVWPPTGTGTSDSPMRDLELLAREIELTHPNVLAVNVVGGFAYADTPDTGVSFSIVTKGEKAAAEQHLDQLCALAWRLRSEGNKVDPPVEEVLAALPRTPDRPLVLAEPSDNIGGGAPGDGTGLLRSLIAHGIQNAAVCLCDAAAVQQLESVASGHHATLALGGKGSRLDEGPLTLEVQLVSRGSGRFALEDRQSHLASIYGDHFDMGPCAVVRHGGVTILLTSNKTPPFDLGQWRSQGIEPTRLSVIGVKAAVAHRRAYEPIASQLLSVDTPGPCRSDLRAFPYCHLRRPIYPLDG